MSLLTFLERESGRVGERTAANYLTAVRSLLRFSGVDDLPLSAITPSLVSRYQQWLGAQGVGLNTCACYLRSLRALYNKAVSRRLVRQRRPFAHVSTANVSPDVPRSLTVDDLRCLSELQLKPGSTLARARDVFLFSFYACGMPFADVCRLQWGQVHDDCLTYHRQKTGQPVIVRLEKPMLDILQRYRQDDSPFLFPFLQRHGYRSTLGSYNQQLARLSEVAGLGVKLSSYMARHSWATIACEQGAPLPVISQAMGHTSVRTTLIYIERRSFKMVEHVNRLILKSVLAVPIRERCKICGKIK